MPPCRESTGWSTKCVNSITENPLPREQNPAAENLHRRAFLSYFGGIGLSGTLLPGVLWAQSREGQEVTLETLAAAEKVAGLEFTDEEREMMLRGLNQNLESYEALRTVSIPNEVSPALHFDPMLPGKEYPSEVRPT